MGAFFDCVRAEVSSSRSAGCSHPARQTVATEGQNEKVQRAHAASSATDSGGASSFSGLGEVMNIFAPGGAPVPNAAASGVSGGVVGARLNRDQ